MKTKAFPFGGFINNLVKSYKVFDQYTLELQTNQPQPRLSTLLGVTVWGNGMRIVPKHIFEKQTDPATFNFFQTPSRAAPTLSKMPTRTATGSCGRSATIGLRLTWASLWASQSRQYILFRSASPEEKRVIAGTQHKLDLFDDIAPEGQDILRAGNSYAKTFLGTFPWADMDDPCERGIQLLDGRRSRPFLSKPEVRWAFALATDIESVSLETFGGSLRVSPLPVCRL